MSAPIKIFSQNIHGMNKNKYTYLSKLIQPGPTQSKIALVSETWWSSLPDWLHHPYTILTSTPPLENAETRIGHATGGLAVIAHPSEKSKIVLISRSTSYILFKYETLKILFVYLPPSMKDDEIESMFLEFPTTIPDIVLGDINCRLGNMNSDTELRPRERCNILLDQIARFNCTYTRSSNHKPEFFNKIDHLFAKPHLNASLTFHPTILASDHGYMDIQIQNPCPQIFENAPPETKRFYIRRLNNPKTQKRFARYYQSNFSNPLGKGSLCDLIRDFQRTAHFHLLGHEDLAEITGLFDEFLTQNVLETATEILGTYKVNEARMQQDAILDQIDAARTNVEATILYKRAQRGNQVPLQPTTAGENIFDEGIEHYRKIWARDPRNLVAPAKPPIEANDPFSYSDVKKIIKRYPATKAPGYDNIHITLLKNLLDTSFTDDIRALFNFCHQVGVTPRSWNEGLTCLLPKDPNSPTVTNTRPISLTRIFRRLFENLLHDSWSHSNWAKLHRSQSGCRTGFSTFTQTMINDHISRHPLSRHEPVRKYSVLLDIAKAFDSVRHVDILNALQKRNCPPRVISLIFNLFMTHTRTRLIINGVRSIELELTNGIFQGSVLSPLIFMIWIDPLCLVLNGDADTFDRALFFVDDIKIKCTDTIEIQHQIGKCGIWGDETDTRFNGDKSTSIRPPPHLPIVEPILQNQIIRTKDFDKYLGVEATHNGAQFKELVIQNFNRAISQIIFLEINGSQWPEWAKLQIYKAFCDSQFNYIGPGIHVWLKKYPATRIKLNLTGQEHEYSIPAAANVLIRRAIRWIFNRPNDIHFVILQHMTLILDPVAKWERLFIQFYHKIDRIHPENPILWYRDKLGNNPVYWPPQALIPHLFRIHPTYREFEKTCENIPDPRKRPKLATFIRKKLIKDQRLANPHLKLHRYITKQARSGSLSRMDSVINIRDKKIRQDAILWRIDRKFYGKACPTCNERFGRSHLTPCNLLPNLANMSFIKNRWQREFDLLKEETSLIRQTTHKQTADAENYSIIDSLLNNHEWGKFQICIQHLTNAIDNERV